MTDEEVREMNEQIKNLPPITGDMVQDYTNLMLKELVALGDVWENGYLKGGNGCGNVLIVNHIKMMQAQYERLLNGVDSIFKDAVGDNSSTTKQGEQTKEA